MKFALISVLVGVVSLVGCRATVDLANDPTISFQDSELAKRMSLMTQMSCTRHSYNRTTGEKTSGDARLQKSPEIKRLFKSASGWVKAEAAVEGVWDSVYLYQQTGQFVCGEKAWLEYPNSKTIEFIEIGSETKLLPVSSSSSTYPTANQKENRSIALRWDGYSNLISVQATLEQTKQKGSISGRLPNNDGTCSGVFEATNGNKGIWTVSCTNGMSASGMFEAYGSGKGSSGFGNDTIGRRVEFTMSGN